MSPDQTALIIGSGGREQALAYFTASSPYVKRVVVAPGNAGTKFLAERLDKSLVNHQLVGDEIGGVIDLVRREKPNLVVVGPEAWLEKGLGDALKEEKVRAIAPTQMAAILETNKAWTRQQAQKWGIPQPHFAVFADPGEALVYVNTIPSEQMVVKVSGLAGGKGVTVCDTKEEARNAVMLAKSLFGRAADTILIEEKLVGTEVSFIGLCDGNSFIPFVPAMDHKRLHDEDLGPNTGGMGVIVPNPAVTGEIAQKITSRIIRPVINGMQNLGKPYIGFLYAGVMLVNDEPYLIEINARGGDPETQVQLPLLDQDLYLLFHQVVSGTLDRIHVTNKKGACALVVMASSGYPEKAITGEVIYGLRKVNDPSVFVFHAGTRTIGGDILTSGGRVLGITAVASTLPDALRKAYSHIGSQAVHFKDMQVRNDIGTLALQLADYGSPN